VEYPYPAPAGRKPRDTVKILSDFGPDGRARKIETFADGLNIPIGLLPLPSARAALVYSIPQILRIEDRDGDGRGEVRETLYTGFGHRDTHGMTNAFTWGFDGWVYACHGFSNTSEVAGKDHRPVVMNSGNTYRMRPDGSHAEFFSHGQVNPFGLAFDPLGNLYSCDCHSRPIYQLLQGAWYPSFGKPDDGLGYGPEMVTHDHGSTGIGGIAYYAAAQFPPEYRGTIFIGNVVTNRVNHDRIEWHGSSPRGIEQPDFVWSEDNWFRPVDIELGPDGALYVADFYNRIIGHYEVPLTHPGRDRTSGRVWRIVYRGSGSAPVFRAIDLTAAGRDQLIDRLSDPTLPVRLAAANQLASRFAVESVEPLRSIVMGAGAATAKVHALWVLERLGQLDVEALTRALGSGERELVVHALGVLADRPGLDSRIADEVSAKLLASADPFVRRAAARVLGAHPRHAWIKPLLGIIESAAADDQALIHVARMTLRDQFLDASAWSALGSLGLTDRDREVIKRIAPGVHTAESAAYLLDDLARVNESAADRVRFVHHIARYGSEEVQGRLAAIAARGQSPAVELAILKAIQQGAQERGRAIDPASRSRAGELASRLLASHKPDEVSLGVDVVRDFGFRELQPRLAAIVEDGKLALGSRSHALGALAAIDPRANRALVVRTLAVGACPVPLRQWAANLLGRMGDPGAREALLAELPLAPESLQVTIAEALAGRKEGAAALLDAVARGKASARLLTRPSVAEQVESSGLPRVKEQLAELTRNLPPVDPQLVMLFNRRKDSFLAAKPRPDPALGAKVFEKNCASCHQLDGKGARIGPQLDGIGTRGLDRLIEDVLDPSRNVDQSFRITTLVLDDGR